MWWQGIYSGEHVSLTVLLGTREWVLWVRPAMDHELMRHKAGVNLRGLLWTAFQKPHLGKRQGSIARWNVVEHLLADGFQYAYAISTVDLSGNDCRTSSLAIRVSAFTGSRILGQVSSFVTRSTSRMASGWSGTKSPISTVTASLRLWAWTT